MSPEATELWDQIRAKPLAVQLELAAALLDNPRPDLRRLAVPLVRIVLRDLEAQEEGAHG